MYHVRTETFFYRTDNGLNRDEVSSFRNICTCLLIFSHIVFAGFPSLAVRQAPYSSFTMLCTRHLSGMDGAVKYQFLLQSLTDINHFVCLSKIQRTNSEFKCGSGRGEGLVNF